MSRQLLSWQHFSISEYLSGYWPDFDQTFLAQFFRALIFGPKFYFYEHNNFLDRNFFGDICPYQEYLRCYWHNFDKTFGQNFFGPRIFLWPKFLRTNTFFEHFNVSTYLWTKFLFRLNPFLDPNFCGLWNLKMNSKTTLTTTTTTTTTTKTKQHQNNWVVTSS